ncbi:MAG: phospholipase D family protein [Burkholderiales bacterium]|nr:phospholipase D family protein [Burkholderiales bacterium]
MLSACGAARLDVPRPVTEAWPSAADTAIARAYAAQLTGHEGKSGLHALPSGMDALGTRAALAEAARHTLDLQYYIVRADTTTQLLMARVLRAAQRGVRVRLLVDDLDAAGKDLDLATLAGFANIEVRVFNPFSSRGTFGLSQVFEFVGSSQRLNRRMHNKLWIADNAMAVIGGRNLGDEYFDAAGEVNFSDLDMLVAGPAVSEISRSFDAYWNSEWSVPIQAFVPSLPSAGDLVRFEQGLRRRVEGFRDGDYARALRESGLGIALRSGNVPLKIAPVEVFADPPEKVAAEVSGSGQSLFAARIRPIVAKATRELILISPYFIPSDEGLEALGAVARRGVRVRVLTNSLASADVVPLAHAGYARRRERLLAAGIELHEMRPERLESVRSRLGSSSGAYLHTKAIVIDRRYLVVGSMNLDPRSRLSNTEIGLFAESSELGETIGQMFDEAVHPSRAFGVSLVGPAGRTPQILWSTEEKGQPVVYDVEPLVSVWRRLFSRLLGAIAPEDLL